MLCLSNSYSPTNTTECYSWNIKWKASRCPLECSWSFNFNRGVHTSVGTLCCLHCRLNIMCAFNVLYSNRRFWGKKTTHEKRRNIISKHQQLSVSTESTCHLPHQNWSAGDKWFFNNSKRKRQLEATCSFPFAGWASTHNLTLCLFFEKNEFTQRNLLCLGLGDTDLITGSLSV